MTTNQINYTRLEQSLMLTKQPEPTIKYQPQECIVSSELEQLLNVERLMLDHAPDIEALILKQMKALQRKDLNNTCRNLPKSLKEFALEVACQPQNRIFDDEEELKRLVLAREAIETCHLHLINIKALTFKRIEALELSIAFTKQDPRHSNTTTPVAKPSAEASVAAPAYSSSSNLRPHRFALKYAFIKSRNDAGRCLFGPLSLLLDQEKKQYTMLEHSRRSGETCRSFSFAADAISSSKFSDVEGNWLVLNLDKDGKTVYVTFEEQVDMLDFLTRIRW